MNFKFIRHPFSILLGVLIVSGCVAPMTNYEKANIYGGGYSDKDLGGGVFEVVFVAQSRQMDFVKFAALYRAAEICYGHTYRYFSVTKVANKSTGTQPPQGGVAPNDPNYIPGIQYTIQCFNQNGSGKIYDAYMILDRYNVPGTLFPHTTAQRRQEALLTPTR